MEDIHFDKIMSHVSFQTIDETESLPELSDLKKAIRLEKGQLTLYENKIVRREKDLKSKGLQNLPS